MTYRVLVHWQKKWIEFDDVESNFDQLSTAIEYALDYSTSEPDDHIGLFFPKQNQPQILFFGGQAYKNFPLSEHDDYINNVQP